MELVDHSEVQVPELMVPKEAMKSEVVPKSEIDLNQAFIRHSNTLDRQSEE